MMSLRSSSSSSSRSSVLLTSVAATTIVAIVYAWKKKNAERKRLGNFPHSSPWFAPLDLVYAIRAGSLPQFVSNRKNALNADNFYIHFFGLTQRPTLMITKPEDQVEIMRKEGKMKLYVEMPPTIYKTHGPGNLQVLSGQRHQFMRKIFASLLSPVALESFVPLIVERFEKMWTHLQEECKVTTVVIQNAICDAQFYLMAEIFYGIVPDTPENVADLESLRKDFELQLESHFMPEKSAKFQKGYEASKRIRAILNQRFKTVLEARRQIYNADEKKDDDNSSPVGNAMESIADALLRDGVADDPNVLSDVYDNLNLLTEASHGTTMTITTTTLYFLSHPDNADKLEKLRNEVAYGVDTPTLSALKGDMPFAEACIKETMRLAPIVGGVAYAMDKGLDVTFKGQQLSGPMSFSLNFSHNYKDTSLFPNPESFLPERWIVGSKEEVSDRARMAYRPFGIGRHICLGYQLALIVMKASLFCFADKKLTIEFDSETVKVVNGIFPEGSVSDGFPGRVVTG